MRVSFIAAECEPWAKTGGLADVVDALARALGQIDASGADPSESVGGAAGSAGGAVTAAAAAAAAAGGAAAAAAAAAAAGGAAAAAAGGAAGRAAAVDSTGVDRTVDVYLPRYRGVVVPDSRLLGSTRLRVPDPTLAEAVTDVDLIDVAADGYRLRLVDNPRAFDREGYYGDAAGDYPDNAWQFGLLCRAAIEAIRRDGGTDILHLHDWHAGPALLLRDGPYARDDLLGPAATLLTIHNLAYRGWVPPDKVWLLALDRPPRGGVASRRSAGVVPANGVDLLRAGIERAELVNTVSPTFAAEALRPEFGMGLDELLAERGDRFFGILNGIDPEVWNPATDSDIAAPYDQFNLGGKAQCRADLLTRVGFDPADNGPVFGAIGRLDPQKGFDLLAAAAPALVDLGARLIVQANGDPRIAQPFRAMASATPGQVAFVERFDRAMARRIYAGADLFLMPSRFEPSGQGQMIAMRYGTPPVVRLTGGLADSVIDVDADPVRGTGFAFGPANAAALVEACRRAIAVRDEGAAGRWTELVTRDMALDFSWRAGPAPRYLEAYARALQLRSDRRAPV